MVNIKKTISNSQNLAKNLNSTTMTDRGGVFDNVQISVQRKYSPDGVCLNESVSSNLA